MVRQYGCKVYVVNLSVSMKIICDIEASDLNEKLPDIYCFYLFCQANALSSTLLS